MSFNPVFVNIIVLLGVVIPLAFALVSFCSFKPASRQQSLSVIEKPDVIEENLLMNQDKEDRELMHQFLFPKHLLRQLAVKRLKEINIKKSREAQQRRMRFRKARKWP